MIQYNQIYRNAVTVLGDSKSMEDYKITDTDIKENEALRKAKEERFYEIHTEIIKNTRNRNFYFKSVDIKIFLNSKIVKK